MCSIGMHLSTWPLFDSKMASQGKKYIAKKQTFHMVIGGNYSGITDRHFCLETDIQ